MQHTEESTRRGGVKTMGQKAEIANLRNFCKIFVQRPLRKQKTPETGSFQAL